MKNTRTTTNRSTTKAEDMLLVNIPFIVAVRFDHNKIFPVSNVSIKTKILGAMKPMMVNVRYSFFIVVIVYCNSIPMPYLFKRSYMLINYFSHLHIRLSSSIICTVLLFFNDLYSVRPSIFISHQNDIQSCFMPAEVEGDFIFMGVNNPFACKFTCG